MDALIDFPVRVITGDGAAVASLLIFLAAGSLALALGGILNARGAVRRRASSIAEESTGPRTPRSPRGAGLKAAQRLGDYVNRHAGSLQGEEGRLLRSRLVQAGYLNPGAVGLFMAARVCGLIVFGIAAYAALPLVQAELTAGERWIIIGGVAILGYFAPQVYLSKRIKACQTEHRSGFPDFMDLMVVCAESGLSMEVSLDRVGRELAETYPSLSAHLHMTILEMRAGRPLGEALERLGDRLGINEARSFATLLQQSEELGSSLTDTLRVYSDDMRHQRLARAEEKAHALPAKLALPLTMCIFPVVMIVTMLPAAVRILGGHF